MDGVVMKASNHLSAMWPRFKSLLLPHMPACGLFVMQGSIVPVTIPPRAHPRGFAIFFLLGGPFPTPGHAERDNSLPPGLLIDHKYVVFVFKIDFHTIAQPDVLTRT